MRLTLARFEVVLDDRDAVEHLGADLGALSFEVHGRGVVSKRGGRARSTEEVGDALDHGEIVRLQTSAEVSSSRRGEGREEANSPV
jgi:hypothetical protein